MSGALDGRVALVTGGGAGIGEGIVRRFAEEGARIAVADRGSGVAIAASTGGVHVPTDVAERDQVEAAVETTVKAYGRIDILVNNAWSGGSVGRVENKTTQQLEHGFALGYLGPFWAMRTAFPHMRANGWGRVINMCSLNGVNAHIGTLEYNTAKEALRTLTRTAAREWAPTGITVNAVCPAAKTPAFERAIQGNPEIEALADSANPMGRLGDSYADIAPVAVFLASEACRYLTGNTLFVDGGAHINGVVWAPDLDAAERS
ncbi:SDR family NAD(P)-dependent oxidoreductase [Amycolatopsis sp. YIM 10]|uniref:SDR family NAD(P)-dependent oxidoreductase n=1 Tax=Amycolatopsis sp. YIM 10 TaxID=2653857 RepID=UPI0012903EA6|nr:SDR family oxidoreductase [Amycolatopsis sp. YIM 10]QFU92487.1 Diacetyl reductase [(S)-acetoin forming] [Amycolatopsis sp. YIM 10]